MEEHLSIREAVKVAKSFDRAARNTTIPEERIISRYLAFEYRKYARESYMDWVGRGAE